MSGIPRPQAAGRPLDPAHHRQRGLVRTVHATGESVLPSNGPLLSCASIGICPGPTGDSPARWSPPPGRRRARARGAAPRRAREIAPAHFKKSALSSSQPHSPRWAGRVTSASASSARPTWTAPSTGTTCCDACTRCTTCCKKWSRRRRTPATARPRAWRAWTTLRAGWGGRSLSATRARCGCRGARPPRGRGGRGWRAAPNPAHVRCRPRRAAPSAGRPPHHGVLSLRGVPPICAQRAVHHGGAQGAARPCLARTCGLVCAARAGPVRDPLHRLRPQPLCAVNLQAPGPAAVHVGDQFRPLLHHY